MSNAETAAARILSTLSDLLQKPLQLADGGEDGAHALRFLSPRLTVVAADGKPFTEIERRLIAEIFEALRMAHEEAARFSELEHRMILTQRENLDLIVKNRVLSEVSSRDTLTGLYNRRYVIEKIDSEMSRAMRHGSPMAVLMLDIDHFKTINDTYGHGVGDQVLKWVGKTVKDSCRVYDVPGRYGGEEFCIVLPETKINGTTVVAERIRTKLSETAHNFGASNVVVTASIGIAGVDSETEENVTLSPAALIERADRALYTAKRAGRNRVEMWDQRLYEGLDSIDH